MSRWARAAVACATLAHGSLVRAQPGASTDPGGRLEATLALARDPALSAVTLLVGFLQRDLDARVRVSAAAALAERADPELADTLELAAERDPDPSVRAAARAAYERTWPLGKGTATAAMLGLVPGLGQLYLRERGEGLGYLGAATALFGGAYLLLRGSPSAALTDPTAGDDNDPLGVELVMAGQNLMFYSAFDAYRDARVLRGDRGARRPITREGLSDLALAPFRPRVLASPWVWIGVPVALGLGLGLEAALAKGDLSSSGRHLTDGGGVDFLGRHVGTAAGFGLGEVYFAGLFLPVGIGEEALFRGVIQSSLGESLGPWGGWAVASAVFGAAHILNFTQAGANPDDAYVAVPFITAVGSSLGLAYLEHDNQLATSVAMHFWYDFLLSTATFIIDPDHQPFTTRLELSL